MRIPVQCFEIGLPFKEPALLAEPGHGEQELKAHLSICTSVYSDPLTKCWDE